MIGGGRENGPAVRRNRRKRGPDETDRNLSVVPDRPGPDTLRAAAAARNATLMLLYAPNRYGPNSAQVLGVLYDVPSGQPLATLHASATLLDEEGEEVSVTWGSGVYVEGSRPPLRELLVIDEAGWKILRLSSGEETPEARAIFEDSVPDVRRALTANLTGDERAEVVVAAKDGLRLYQRDEEGKLSLAADVFSSLLDGSPADALASTAAYLARFGWQRGLPWGVEVQLPRGFDFGLTGDQVKKSPADWAALGVRDVDGRAVPNHGAASILMPAGARGAAFMIFKNFQVIERYNAADAYVIGVGHLADRISGGGPIRAGWPRDDRALLFAERRELQERLTRAGFNTQGVDGKIGPNTITAIRAYQQAVGMIPDGYASLDVLKRLR